MSMRGRYFPDMDKNIHKHYNIYKYNTKGKRRSAHSPKGGVAYGEIVCVYYRLVKRYKINNNHDKKKITALLEQGGYSLK